MASSDRDSMRHHETLVSRSESLAMRDWWDTSRRHETSRDNTWRDTIRHHAWVTRHHKTHAHAETSTRYRAPAMSLLGWVGLNSVSFWPHIPILNNRVSFLDPWLIVTRDSRMADSEGEEVVLTVTDVSCVPEVGCCTYCELRRRFYSQSWGRVTHERAYTPHPADFRP